ADPSATVPRRRRVAECPIACRAYEPDSGSAPIAELRAWRDRWVRLLVPRNDSFPHSARPRADQSETTAAGSTTPDTTSTRWTTTATSSAVSLWAGPEAGLWPTAWGGSGGQALRDAAFVQEPD